MGFISKGMEQSTTVVNSGMMPLETPQGSDFWRRDEMNESADLNKTGHLPADDLLFQKKNYDGRQEKMKGADAVTRATWVRNGNCPAETPRVPAGRPILAH